MTPEDFVRSLTYGAKQPDGLGLDSYNKYDPNVKLCWSLIFLRILLLKLKKNNKMQKLELNIDNDSVFRHLNKQGLISFSDYIF